MRQVIRKNIKEEYNIDDEEYIYTLLLDMNSIMKMSLIDKRLNEDGLEYGMIYQTLLQIKKQLEKKDYNFVYAMYDGYNSGQLRYEIYKDYKANRDKNYENTLTEYDKKIDSYCKKVLDYHNHNKSKLQRSESDEELFNRQREIIFMCLEELFCRNVMCDYVEGDDLIAYYVNHKKKNEKIVIVSGDRDLTQLISDDVCIYVTQLKKYVTPQNHMKIFGYPHQNVLIKKIICGDSSDNIKGIDGIGEKTFFKLFPEALTREIDLSYIFEKSKSINEERKLTKKKKLIATENILNANTSGIQGKDIFNINEQLIDLKNPLLTNDAKKELDEISYTPLDPDNRTFENLYNIITQNKITELVDTNKFSEFFSSFYKLIDNEKKFIKNV